MIRTSRPPTLFESASDVVLEGFERARGAIDTVAERASEAAEIVDVDSVRSIGHGLVANLQARQQDCTGPIKEARDDERLKSAVMAGVVVFILGLIVLLLAREVAKRRAKQRRPRQALNRPESASNEE